MGAVRPHPAWLSAALMTLLLLAAMAASAATTSAARVVSTPPPTTTTPRSFTVRNNTFYLDATPTRILAGEFHYFRIPRAYWADRLARAASLGLNALQIYIPWNFHERAPGQVTWDGDADLGAFLSLAHDAGFLVFLRPGPYICAEWDGGGLPWWLRSPAVAGGGEGSGGWRPDGRLSPRSADPLFLGHVQRWFSAHLLPVVAPFMASRGGPIVAVQVENEYGFCGDAPGDEKGAYLRAVADILRAGLDGGGGGGGGGSNGGGQAPHLLLYTTDPPSVIAAGTLPDPAIVSMVDFAPGTDVAWAFGSAEPFNPPGSSPALVTEWYTGWLTHYGESMAHTDTGVLQRGLASVLAYTAPGAATGGSVSFYMAVGGTNAGWWGGANIAGRAYLPHITSYDYDGPVGEAGGEGQAGVPEDEDEKSGSSPPQSKADVIRDALRAVHAADGSAPLAPLTPVPPPPVRSYGEVVMGESAPLLSPTALRLLAPGAGVLSPTPLAMESVGQGHGLILYRATAPASAFACDAAGKGPSLDTGGPVHDYATVLLSGPAFSSSGAAAASSSPVVVGRLDRSAPGNLTLPCVEDESTAIDDDEHEHDDDARRPSPSPSPTSVVTLSILVEAMGRDNFGCGELDWKGLETGVRLGGKGSGTNRPSGWRIWRGPGGQKRARPTVKMDGEREERGGPSRTPSHAHTGTTPAHHTLARTRLHWLSLAF